MVDESENKSRAHTKSTAWFSVIVGEPELEEDRTAWLHQRGLVRNVDYSMVWVVHSLHFYFFRAREDAIMFKLTWGAV